MSVEVQNPFTLIFGKSPLESISRLAQTNEIIDAFSTEILNQQIYMITGVRGSGKTVMLTDISKHFKKDKDWIVIELNPDRDLLRSFAAKLYDEKYLREAFLNAKLDLSILGKYEEYMLDIEKGIGNVEVQRKNGLDEKSFNIYENTKNNEKVSLKIENGIGGIDITFIE